MATNDPTDLTKFPVPSSSYYVLERNSSDLDALINGDAETVTSRAGKSLKTAAYLDRNANEAAASAASAASSEANAAASESNAAAYASAATAAGNYVSEWSVATGAGSKGTYYAHNNKLWLLLKDVADITTQEPTDLNAAYWIRTDNRVAYEPSVKPTMRLDFANNEYEIYDSAENSFQKKPLTDILTITRSTGTTVTTPTGKVASIGVDKPAFDFEDGVSKGLRVNQSYTNLKPDSNALLGVDDSCTTVATAEISNVTGSTLNRTTLTGSTGTHRTSTVTTLADATTGNTAVFIKNESVTGSIALRINGSDSLSNSAEVRWYPDTDTVQLINGEGGLNTFDGIDVYMEKYSDGTRRISVTLNKPAATNHQIRIIGSGNSGESFVWSDMQLTATPYPMPYTKTEGSQVTVGADNVTRTLGEEFNSGEFTIVGRLKATNYQGEGTVANGLVTLTEEGNASSDFLGIAVNESNFKYRIYHQNTGVLQGINKGIGDTITFAIAVNQSTSESKAYIDGVLVDSSSSPFDISGFNRINIGSYYVLGNRRGACEIDFIDLYPKALSEEECIQLTK